MSGNASSGGIGLAGVLFVVFLTLRLTDHIDWEWYWVAAPLWIPMALALGVFAIFGAVALGFWLWERGRP